MATKSSMFIVEDDPAFNKLLTAYFKSKAKWEVHSYLSGEECLENLHLKPVVWLQDFDLPGINGLEVMKRAKLVLPKTEFIFLSGQSDIKVAVDALKAGAFDYVIKDASAKENAMNKVGQVHKIKTLEVNSRATKFALILLAATFVFSWLLYWFLQR